MVDLATPERAAAASIVRPDSPSSRRSSTAAAYTRARDLVRRGSSCTASDNISVTRTVLTGIRQAAVHHRRTNRDNVGVDGIFSDFPERCNAKA